MTADTTLTSQYAAQIEKDLERNSAEQERIASEVAALQEQLQALQSDHAVLVNMQQALGEGTAALKPSVPQQASSEPKQRKTKKSVTVTAKNAAPKKPATKTSTTAGKPTLVELIRAHLDQQSEPRSAAEITTALAQAHPDRNIKATVVRTTVEGLVARSRAHRSKQGASVFYTAAETSEPAAAEPQAEEVAS